MANFAGQCAGLADSADRNLWLVVQACLDMTSTLADAASKIMESRQLAPGARKRALGLLGDVLSENQPCGICGKTGGEHGLHCPMRLKKKLK